MDRAPPEAGGGAEDWASPRSGNSPPTGAGRWENWGSHRLKPLSGGSLDSQLTSERRDCAKFSHCVGLLMFPGQPSPDSSAFQPLPANPSEPAAAFIPLKHQLY